MQSSVIRVEKASQSLSIPSIFVTAASARFNGAASHKYNIYDYTHLEFFADVRNKLLGVKMIKNGDEDNHFTLHKRITGSGQKNPFMSFSAARIMRLFGVDFKCRNQAGQTFKVIPSDNQEVDFWIDMSESVTKNYTEEFPKIQAISSDFQSSMLVPTRFQLCVPKVPFSRTSPMVKGETNGEKELNTPMVRVSKSFMSFNRAAIRCFKLHNKEGVEVFIDTESNQLGLRFSKTKTPECYTLTRHKANGSVLFSFLGILKRLGFSNKSKGFMHSASTYIRIQPSNIEGIDCMVDMTAVAEAYGVIPTTGMRPIKSLPKSAV